MPVGGVGARAEALKFLVHLIGDLHNPMHATTYHDRGGTPFLATVVLAAMLAACGESLQLRRVGPEGRYRMELIGDSGAAATDALPLSEGALGWLATATFRRPADDRTH